MEGVCLVGFRVKAVRTLEGGRSSGCVSWILRVKAVRISFEFQIFERIRLHRYTKVIRCSGPDAVVKPVRDHTSGLDSLYGGNLHVLTVRIVAYTVFLTATTRLVQRTRIANPVSRGWKISWEGTL